MGFPRQDHWEMVTIWKWLPMEVVTTSELPLSPTGDLPSSGIKPRVSCIDRWILYYWATREAPDKSLVLAQIDSTG